MRAGKIFIADLKELDLLDRVCRLAQFITKKYINLQLPKGSNDKDCPVSPIADASE
jgi:hypothetical protein